VQTFISYTKSDREAALELFARLRAAGVDAWLDAVSLYPGDNWSLEIGKALDKSDAIVALVSVAALDSEGFRRELQYALGAKRFQNRLFTVVLEPQAAEKLPWILREAAWLEGPLEAVASQIAGSLAAQKEAIGASAVAGS
jgi:TIR domain